VQFIYRHSRKRVVEVADTRVVYYGTPYWTVLFSHSICGAGKIFAFTLGVASTSLSLANMSAPLLGVLKMEPESPARGVLG
jgi:hypothetical protein